MKKLVGKILVLLLLVSFTIEMTLPIFRNINSVNLLMDTKEADEKKDNDKKEKEDEAKDKFASSIKFFLLVDTVTHFFYKNVLVLSLDFPSLREMPPDLV